MEIWLFFLNYAKLAKQINLLCMAEPTDRHICCVASVPRHSVISSEDDVTKSFKKINNNNKTHTRKHLESDWVSDPYGGGLWVHTNASERA